MGKEEENSEIEALSREVESGLVRGIRLTLSELLM